MKLILDEFFSACVKKNQKKITFLSLQMFCGCCFITAVEL